MLLDKNVFHFDNRNLKNPICTIQVERITAMNGSLPDYLLIGGDKYLVTICKWDEFNQQYQVLKEQRIHSISKNRSPPITMIIPMPGSTKQNEFIVGLSKSLYLMEFDIINMKLFKNGSCPELT